MLVGTALLALIRKNCNSFLASEYNDAKFYVIALGAIYGRDLGVATILLYLFEGAIGLPVFTGVLVWSCLHGRPYSPDFAWLYSRSLCKRHFG